MAIRPVILCGGSGTRLWPLSREHCPKQFIRFGGDTLFSQTIRRAQKICGQSRPIIVCSEKHRFFVAELLQELDVSADIILEPCGKNTAPAIALSVLCAQESVQSEEDALLILPSDHAIQNIEMLTNAVQSGEDAVRTGRILTFGITPSRPETGYGYIRQGEAEAEGIYRVAAFIEKPDTLSAERLLKDGNTSWNSGMFLFLPSVYSRELQRYREDIWKQCQEVWQTRQQGYDFIRLDGRLYEDVQGESIDYAVMEHTQIASVMPLALVWSDLGSWDAFHELGIQDAQGNACFGDALCLESKGCYIHATSRLIAAVGLEDVAVVETPDAVLVIDRNKAQDVRKAVEILKEAKRTEVSMYPIVSRPWGSYEVIMVSAGFQVKKIRVKSGGILSLQRHQKRAEHWVVVHGEATVTVGDITSILQADMSTYIPMGVLHRLENTTSEPLELIEVQTGSYLGEDDIERFEDAYGRC